jgi:HK97 gp10 family phage protein
MNVEIDKKTLEKLQRQLKEVVKKDKEAAFKGMITTGYEIHREAVKKVPVDMGRLRSSLAVEGDKGQMEVRVGTNVKYAPFVELGTRPHTPPLEPIQEWADRKGADGGAVWASIRKHGTKPHPFLRTAFAEKIGNLLKNIKRFVND